ncbi:DRTGG domain-containing protein [Globicatella sp. PHS-GS-PNBC-21-1553]|uniref:DRTGG domain-containing protein n=1 Tax=Globicatella sp. PHS-GS-PNBC-21-1553 TaxID=2885764 RepID=UPI00298EDDD2|nr:DRTGG domain-containing protein [Globicatella sp. PHS-GS-PNBC-21-1553]WPC08714.1 CBS domain-containing protein [Globicatella sp. PHS-GS-PNBC-21-1553]
MATKHEQILQYIKSLPVGNKISVRGIAKKLNMSEGTAYRAIKEAETRGLVSTIERVGTIRIEQKVKYLTDMLTFKEVVNIIDGDILGGSDGLSRHLNKFIIGAMKEDAMVRYFSEQSLLIVGNRTEAQLLALEHDVAVLITGGFKANPSVIQLANERNLPLISTSYDTFTVATMINRSISDQLIKKEILTIEDIYTPIEKTVALTAQDNVRTFHKMSDKTGLSRFPVVYNNRLIGVVTAKDLIGRDETVLIERVMTKETVTVKLHMSIASVSHKMIWEDIEMIPVVADNLQLLGVVSRQDVMKAIHTIQQQPQIVHTFEDDLAVHLDAINHTNKFGDYDFQAIVQPQMINNLGTISYGVLCELITQTAQKKVVELTNLNNIIEKIEVHYFNLIQIGNEIHFKVDVFHHNRRSALVQVDVFHENTLAARAIITSQIIERG